MRRFGVNGPPDRIETLAPKLRRQYLNKIRAPSNDGP